MNILVTGATGMVGSEVIRQAIIDSDIKTVTAITRNPLSIQHVKLKTIIHRDFLDYSDLSDVFKQQDACLWCLGISQSQVNKEQYHVITYDYAVSAGQIIVKENPEMTFVFLSGAGADSKERSSTLFARVKGKTENALLKLGFKKIYIARPAGIKPIRKNPNTALVNKIMIPLFPILELVYPAGVITSVQLARAMLHIAKHGSDKTILENSDLKQIANPLSP